MIHLKVAESHYKIVNLYAPNNEYERVRFMNNMTAILSDDNDKYTETVIEGDFNCVLDSDIDRKNCTASHDVGQQDIRFMMDCLELEDIWGRRNPSNRSYTWEGRGRMSRIDYWLISKAIDNQIEKVTIEKAPFSDHSSLYLT